MAAISGVVSSSSREVPYAPASVSGSDVGTARAYNNASAIVSFTAPVHDGGLPVTGYAVTSSPGGFTASGSSSPLTITGLSSSTCYTYNVTATNSIGTGPAITSGSVFATTIPQPVTIGTATATGAAGTVTVAFTANGTGGKTVTYTATSSPGGFTGSSSGSPITVTGLTNGTAYTFTVVASNANGSAAASGASNSATPFTTPPPPPTPGPIGSSTPVASASGNTVSSTSGAWGAGTTPTSYQYNLYRSDGTYIATSGSVSTSTTSISFTASYSTSYYVTVTASNSNGNGTMTSNTVTTGAEPAPVVAPGSMAGRVSGSWNNGLITFSWSPPTTGTAPFSYEYSLGYGFTSTNSTSYSVYADSQTITVRAVNSAGTGESGSASVTRPPIVTAPGSMAGLVSGYYNGSTLQSNFSWSAPTGTAPFTYYYSFGGTTFSTTGTTANTSGGATITVFASNSAGTGGSGGATVSPPAPEPYYWYCTTSVQCAGVGNCTQQAYSSNQTQSGSGYSIACSYNNTGTYPSCQSTAGATCTGNLGCCSQGLKYRCSDYDVNNSASVNYFQCYSVGDCDANSDPAGVRTRCCPTEC